jgi:alpha-tubulin suppressor-like RCC1 family protein
MKCWGANNYGQIGDGTTSVRNTAVDVSIDHDVTAIALGIQHTCALESTGGVSCWGYNYSGEIGDGTTTHRHLPVSVYDLGPGSGVKAIAAADYHSCALTRDTTVQCWGTNNHGQLGTGNTTVSHVPVEASGLGTGIVEVSAGGEHTCALDASARPFCWGNDPYGQVGYAGIGSNFYVYPPVRVSGLDSPATQVSLMRQTSCAVTAAGGAMCWGNNDYGQIGDGSQTDTGNSISHYGARDVAGLTGGVRQVAAGEHHACALKNDGSVWCWGDNSYGQVGDGTSVKRLTPVQVSGIDGAVAIDAGLSHTCALTAAGAVYCWGRNERGEIGDGSTDNRNTAVAVVGLDAGVAAIALGQAYSCALLQDGGVRCWGYNNVGQIGDASTTDRHVPTAIDDSDAYARISAGGDHTCGVTTAGAAKCWGYNSSGQLGDGTTTARKSPTPVDGLDSGVSLVAAGAHHSCAVQDGVLKCWGYNGYYQLGDGGHVNQALPETIVAISGSIDAVELGEDRSCVLLADGDAKCFGYNHYGSLGNGWAGGNQIVPADIARWAWDDHIFTDGFED